MRFSTALALITAASSALTAQDKTDINEGDTRSIRFTLPFEAALVEARESGRLLFLKPIYGGVDQLGARDYRCGDW